MSESYNQSGQKKSNYWQTERTEIKCPDLDPDFHKFEMLDLDKHSIDLHELYLDPQNINVDLPPGKQGYW